MLQQTQADRVREYWERFTTAFPTIEALAAASLDDVLRQWEGLGYYARARNLHAAARKVMEHFGGQLPDSVGELSTLQGFGPYTARAVSSIAFSHPHAAVDANVIRVITRVFGISGIESQSAVRREIQALADELLDTSRPGAFNQALMDLGATVCKPIGPRCTECPLYAVCLAYAEGAPEAYPVKKAKQRIPVYEIVVGLLFDDRGRLLVQRRSEDSMLGGLWEFPGGKREQGESLEEACRREVFEEIGVDVEPGECLCTVRHTYSHFGIVLHAFDCRRWTGMPDSGKGLPLRWVDRHRLSELAFPRANRRILEILEEAEPR